MDESKGKMMAIIGIVVAIIGFFFWQILLGAVAIVLGILALGSPQKGLGWAAIVLGAIACIIGFF